MYQTLEQPDDFVSEIALRGLTLHERLRIGRARKCFGKIDNYSLERVSIWRSWFEGTGGRNAWLRFLAQEGLSEAKLICLDNLADHKNKLPDWSATLGRIFDYLQQTATKSDSRLSVCENLATPLVNFAWHELATSTSRSHLRLLSSTAALEFARSLRQRLARTGNEAAQWEVLVADADQKFMGVESAAGAKSHDYFFYAGVSKVTLHFLQNYPALARLWAVQVTSWLRFVCDFLRHVSAFAYPAGGRIDNRQIIRTRDSCWRHIPIISRLETDLSDPHEGNRTVIRVRFADNDEWFYKPRSGLQESAWFELLDWINIRGFARSFQILTVVCKDRHCWIKGVRPRPCRNRKEAEDYGFRLGALICLIDVLRGVDFHPANIVGAGDQPIVIDCETLFHPATALTAYVRADDSVARTGMLRLVQKMSVDNVAAGFRAMHDFLRQRSVSQHLRRWTSRLQRIPGRNVYRPTLHYYEILQGSLAPSVLTNGLEHSLWLRAACRIDCRSTRRVQAEARALQNADIPVFRSRRGKVKIDLSEKKLRNSIATVRTTVETVASSVNNYQGCHVQR